MQPFSSSKQSTKLAHNPKNIELICVSPVKNTSGPKTRFLATLLQGDQISTLTSIKFLPSPGYRLTDSTPDTILPSCHKPRGTISTTSVSKPMTHWSFRATCLKDTSSCLMCCPRNCTTGGFDSFCKGVPLSQYSSAHVNQNTYTCESK